MAPIQKSLSFLLNNILILIGGMAMFFIHYNIVLENFNLSIPAGKTLALVGRSGGGKSTIINLLLRFYDAKQGRLLLDGEPYKNIKVNQLRRLFGVVTQNTELFLLTIEENIAYGLSKPGTLSKLPKKAQAYDFILQMKDGFQTRIGEILPFILVARHLFYWSLIEEKKRVSCINIVVLWRK